MLYELRVYDCIPGRLPALLNRFQNHTTKIWERHGIKQGGFFTTLIGGHNQRLTYFLVWESLAEREHFTERHALLTFYSVAVAPYVLRHGLAEPKTLVAQLVHQFGVELSVRRVNAFDRLEQRQWQTRVERTSGEVEQRDADRRRTRCEIVCE